MAHEGLEHAIEFAREGQRFYAKAAAGAADPLAARLFAFLTVDELEHRLRLQTELEGLAEHGRWEPGFPPGPHLEEALRGFFSGAGRAGLREHPEGAGDAGRLEAAMGTERQGVARYDGLVAGSRDEAERAFFQSLRDEEGDHLAALENVHRYLTAPAASVEPGESHAWSWMRP